MRRPVVAALAALFVAALALPAAVAATLGAPLGLDIERVEANPDGATSITVSVSGLPPGEALDPADIEVVENGAVVEDVTTGSVQEVGQEALPAAVVIAVDLSGSLDEPTLAAAKSAATGLAEDVVDADGLVSVVSFADTVTTEVPLTSDGDRIVAAIDALEAGGATALYDAISRSARIGAVHNGPADVVVFTDGEDNGSSSGLDDVRALLSDTDIPVTSVRLVNESDDSALDAIAAVSGGSVVRVQDVAELAAAFESISADLRNRVTLSWVTQPAIDPPALISVVATYRSGDQVASDGDQIPNPRFALVTPPRPVEVAGPVIGGIFATEAALWLGVVGAGLAVLLLAFVLLAAAGRRQRERRLDRRLSVYEGAGGEPIGSGPRPTGSRSLSSRAADVVDAIPRPTTLDARLAAKIEQADWPMRVGEFLLLVVATGVGVLALILLVSAAPWWLAAISSLIAVVLPFGVLEIAVSRRQRAFADQLPDVLQVIGGALRAGHAFSTAVDGAVPEVDDPASSELRRASVEARLGRPMDKALLGVAERMDSIDLTWVVNALAVQREVGGNLAEVLDNVARTLRARASVRRQVSALSAEGRLSANIISAVPFLMFFVLTIISPGYVSILFERREGLILILIGLVLLVFGIIWLRRLVKPQF